MKGPNSKSLANFEEEKTNFLQDIYNRLEKVANNIVLKMIELSYYIIFQM
jgi:hypothetical protein